MNSSSCDRVASSALPGPSEEGRLRISPDEIGSRPARAEGKTLILGLGNDILTDDAIGLHVVRRLGQELAGDDHVDVRETMEMGLALLDFMVGYQTVVIVDSIQTGRAPAGTIHEVDAAALPHQTGRTPHFLGVGETLALGRHLGLPMPEQVRIIAVEVDDPFTLGTEMTPPLQNALPLAVERVQQTLRAIDHSVRPCV